MQITFTPDKPYYVRWFVFMLRLLAYEATVETHWDRIVKIKYVKKKEV